MQWHRTPPYGRGTRAPFALIVAITACGTLGMHLVIPALPDTARALRVSSGTIQLTITAPEDAGGPPATVRIEECEPNRRLRLTIEMGDGEPWVISVDLAPAPEGTVLGFRQVLPPGFSPTDVGPGWHWYLDRLGADLAGTPFPAWPDYEALGEHYA